MSLHSGVLIYGLAEGTLPGPSAAQSLMRMIQDSSMDEAEGGRQLGRYAYLGWMRGLQREHKCLHS